MSQCILLLSWLMPTLEHALSYYCFFSSPFAYSFVSLISLLANSDMETKGIENLFIVFYLFWFSFFFLPFFGCWSSACLFFLLLLLSSHCLRPLLYGNRRKDHLPLSKCRVCVCKCNGCWWTHSNLVVFFYVMWDLSIWGMGRESFSSCPPPTNSSS